MSETKRSEEPTPTEQSVPAGSDWWGDWGGNPVGDDAIPNKQFGHSGARYNDRSAATAAAALDQAANIQFQQQAAFIREMFGSKDERGGGDRQEQVNNAILDKLTQVVARLDKLEKNP